MDPSLLNRSWTHEQGFQLSTNPNQIPLSDLNDFFSDMPWANPLPEAALRNLIRQSLCFALYDVHNADHKLVGIARWISDFVSVAYLTDVYLLPAYRSQGLGKWMMSCIDETFHSMEHLRGMILIVDRGGGEEILYRKYLGMDDLQSPAILLDRKGRGSAR
ncbi:hypothetical protein LTR84_003004 [Exophiala bonariae]|uniref:N-acetyltransferase domain-containing protein n=1 Tax=Exophiala bonariae TaxID=1690606 RepID=A0AAV9N7U0_9EURO|nr:hypothetical protein LTR84_003004 [Exophiala bonariae]